jgi:histidinol-phosphate aminotransferase
MAAMRIGCLMSQAPNVSFLHKAQSPYSVNALAVLAASVAVQDRAYVAAYVAEALRAREMLCRGLERLGIGYYPSRGNFILAKIGPRSIEIRDRLREKSVLVRDRSYEIDGAVRITAGTCEQTERFLDELEKIWR